MGYFRYIENLNYSIAPSAKIDSIYSPYMSAGNANMPLQSGLLAPPKLIFSSNTGSLNSNLSLSSSYSSNSLFSSNSNYDNGESELKPGLFKGRLAGKEALVTQICRKYNVSPALVASIIGLESGWGTSNLAMHNNFMGYRAAGDLGKNEKGFGYFSTIEKGLEAAIKNLAGYTRFSDVSKVDFNNLDAIGRHYCEEGVWANRVRNIYNTTVTNYLA